jgi:hypothetical protein
MSSNDDQKKRMTDYELIERIKTLLRERRKVDAVQLYLNDRGCGLKMAKDAVDEIEQQMRS